MNVKIFCSSFFLCVLVFARFLIAPTNAQSPTETPSATATVSSTITATLTITPTDTVSPTATPTLSATATPTLTPTAAVATATPTPSPTQTVLPTATPTPSATATATPTNTPTPTPTLRTDVAINVIQDPFYLACLLPDGESPTNALGIVDKCGWIPVQVKIVKAAPTPVPTVKAAAPTAAPTPKGDSPQSAMSITNAWLTLGPGQMHWYKIDNHDNFYLDLWLDAYGKGGITMAVYSPEQTNVLSLDTPAKGRGSPVKNDPTHDLLWSGAQARGVWHVLVRNYNPVPVDYRVGSRQATEDRNCTSYWEWIGKDLVFWTACR